MTLLDEGHHLIAELEHGIHRFRSHVAQQDWTTMALELLDNLITSGQKLKAERADLLTDRDAQKARAEKAEAALAALQGETEADEAKVKAALDEINAEVEAEAPVAEPASDSADPAAPIVAAETPAV